MRTSGKSNIADILDLLWVEKDTGTPVRVMGVLDGWCVCRFKGCAPFLIHCRDFERRFIRRPGF